MGDVIDFPYQDRSFLEIERWIIDTCVRNGLTPAMAQDVAAEYRTYHEELFDCEASSLAIPEGAALSEHQATTIIPLIRNIFMRQTARSAHIIIGLLARERLHRD
ncbi:hypothetical protein [Azoarcus sp. DN11]|uniref:hypothetical protein n=1 Tax=Azoarcus sp. DN11 TaxID=356837 RepID=UPI000EAD85C7|nr:hypothetical protein [Azoarcus sp. DN11]AYH46096.1 hypothetical protein CDA09_22420 [Azoarcus sp. DN11]